MVHFFDDPTYDFEVRLVLGGVQAGCGDVGEILTAVAAIQDGDDASWVAAWESLAGRIEWVAEAALGGHHPISARDAYLRAATYYAAAMSAADGLPDPGPVIGRLFRAHRRCFDGHVGLLDPPAQRVAIPYPGSDLPGYLFRPPGEVRRRPTLILNNGSDGPLTTLWPVLGGPALARGYNALVFDGPGQQSMLFERGVPFRPDWERVITPIVDLLLGRPDVDPERIALYGISQAGYWVPRALAFEQRIAAAVADPGVVDVGTSWRENLPASMLQLLDAGDDRRFDELLEEGLREAGPRQRRTLEWRSKPYGKTSAAATFRAVGEYRLGDLTSRIRTPMLIADPEREQFWPGQSRALFDALGGRKLLVPFTQAEGADGHCEPMARSLFCQRTFDWLDEVLEPAVSPR